MTPKEKAFELIELFTFNCRECDNSKISALIAVDEMIEIYVSACVAMGMSKEDAEKQESKYLQEVKKEIENL
jgi:transcription elongation factor Elf1